MTRSGADVMTAFFGSAVGAMGLGLWLTVQTIMKIQKDLGLPVTAWPSQDLPEVRADLFRRCRT
jgi:hypothetical protein